jgi:uncharacterized membrane protein
MLPPTPSSQKNPYLRNLTEPNDPPNGSEFCLRKTLLGLVFILSLALVTGSASPQAVVSQVDDILLDPVSITAVMSQQGTTIVTFNAFMTNNGSSEVGQFVLRVDSLDANVLSATVNGSSTGAYAALQERYTEIVVTLPAPVAVGESVWLNIRVRADDVQDQVLGTDGTTVAGDFIFYVRPLDVYHNFTFTATLPEEALLSDQSLDPVFPDSDSNFTDGRSLSFVWFTPLLQPGQERVFIVKYQLACPGTSALVASPLFLAIGLTIGAVVGAAAVLFGPKLVGRVRKIGKVRFVGVTNEEEEILGIIREKGGSCLQKDLYTDTEMSQAKVSLILNNLEERGLVRRFREGRENLVHIMED